MAAEQVELGRDESGKPVLVPVVAQSGPYLARLEKEIPELFGALSGGLEGGILSLGWDTLYTLTSKLIPAVSGAWPRYRWNGYSTREGFEDPEAEPDALDNAPAHAEVIAALELAIKINRLDIYGSLGKALLGNGSLSTLTQALTPSEPSTPSSTEPSPTGESPSTTPSGMGPTSTQNED